MFGLHRYQMTIVRKQCFSSQGTCPQRNHLHMDGANMVNSHRPSRRKEPHKDCYAHLSYSQLKQESKQYTRMKNVQCNLVAQQHDIRLAAPWSTTRTMWHFDSNLRHHGSMKADPAAGLVCISTRTCGTMNANTNTRKAAMSKNIKKTNSS